jgi:hypothetical protein
MKRNLIFHIVIISLINLLFSCKKEIEPVDYSNSIIGKWKWLETMVVYPPSSSNPSTPKNTGIDELLVFNPDNTWYKTQNAVLSDSGKYSLGRGTYTNPSTKVYSYDSICYYHNNIQIKNGYDYYEINHDTLVFCSGFANRWWSYTLSHAGTKHWIRQN